MLNQQQVIMKSNVRSVFMSYSNRLTLTIAPELNLPACFSPADLRELRQVPGGAQRLRQGPAEPDAGYLGLLVS